MRRSSSPEPPLPPSISAINQSTISSRRGSGTSNDALPPAVAAIPLSDSLKPVAAGAIPAEAGPKTVVAGHKTVPAGLIPVAAGPKTVSAVPMSGNRVNATLTKALRNIREKSQVGLPTV